MSHINAGEPAFPLADPMCMSPKNVAEMRKLAAGMSLRDYFAAKAMQTLIAMPSDRCKWEDVARFAYDFADDMMALRRRDAEEA